MGDCSIMNPPIGGVTRSCQSLTWFTDKNIFFCFSTAKLCWLKCVNDFSHFRPCEAAASYDDTISVNESCCAPCLKKDLISCLSEQLHYRWTKLATAFPVCRATAFFPKVPFFIEQQALAFLSQANTHTRTHTEGHTCSVVLTQWANAFSFSLCFPKFTVA